MSPSPGETDENEAKKSKSLEVQIQELNVKVGNLVDTITQLNNTIKILNSEKHELMQKINEMESSNQKQKTNKKGKKTPRKSANKPTSNRNISAKTAAKQKTPMQKRVEKDETIDIDIDNNSFVSVEVMSSDDVHAKATTSTSSTNMNATNTEANQTTVNNKEEEDNNNRESSDESDDESGNESDEKDSISVSDDDNTNTQNTIKRSNKEPPIDIWTSNRSEIQRVIQQRIPSNSCLFGRVNNGKFRVFPADNKTRVILINFLSKRKYQFNTYTPTDEKIINVVIKGLDHIDDPDIIKENLAAEGFVPHKVQKHITGYMRKNQVKSNLWHVILQPNTDTKALFGIKVIENAIVKFEFLKKTSIIQCKRCQRLFHSASNCNLPYRCVKCTKSHEPGQCSSNTDSNKFSLGV